MLGDALLLLTSAIYSRDEPSNVGWCSFCYRPVLYIAGMSLPMLGGALLLPTSAIYSRDEPSNVGWCSFVTDQCYI